MSFEHREYIGTIIPPFDGGNRRETKNGWFVDFTIEQTGGKIIPCRVFQEVYEAANAIWEAGKKVALFGYLHGDQLRVKVARAWEKPAIQKHLAYNGETLAEARQAFEQRKKEMAKRGVVPVREETGIGWYPEVYTIKDGKRRKLKIDYVMERLGGPYVTFKLRAEKFVEMTTGKPRIGKLVQAHYLKLLDQLVEEAQASDAAEF